MMSFKSSAHQNQQVGNTNNKDVDVIQATINAVLVLSRSQKQWIAVLFDLIFLTLSFVLAVAINENSLAPLESYFVPAFAVVLVNIIIFSKLGLYLTVLRFISAKALLIVASGVSITSLFLCFFSFFELINLSELVALNFWCFSLITVGATRLAISSLIHNQTAHVKESVIIYGAGTSGRQLSFALTHGQQYNPVAFIDDDKSLQNTQIQGIPVLGYSKLNHAIRKYEAKSIFLAITSTTRNRRKEIIESLEPYAIKVKTIPDIADILSGQAKIEEIRDIEIEDLLGRDTVSPDTTLLEKCVTGKVVMVTGAGGSIGSELCRQIVKLKPESLILFELSEYGLYAIDQELKKIAESEGTELKLYPFLGSVQHKKRMTEIMTTFKVDTVYHAAAYKHVPIVENNIIEGVRNNVFGTYFTAEAAIEAQVSTFVLISTDKAVRPTNFMGTTKRLAELTLQALQTTTTNTKFCMVRFGNVLGSSGSVVPLFREQIQKGGPVTVTHPEITRYFMTIPEAAELVIQASALANGGEVFVLDMGESVKINELAKKMIRLMGFEPMEKADDDGDIEIVYTGLRPGEKLFEELLIGSNVEGSSHPRILCAKEEYLSYDLTKRLLNELEKACYDFDYNAIREILLKAPTSFEPKSEMCDLLYSQLGVNTRIETNGNVSWILSTPK